MIRRGRPDHTARWPVPNLLRRETPCLTAFIPIPTARVSCRPIAPLNVKPFLQRKARMYYHMIIPTSDIISQSRLPSIAHSSSSSSMVRKT